MKRDPLDPILDTLSDSAFERLANFEGLERVIPYPTHPGYAELVNCGFLVFSGGTVDGTSKVTLTFDGANARLRLNSGLYAAQRKIAENEHARVLDEIIGSLTTDHSTFGMF